ncbi:peptidase inhibitor family I36 protein [Nitratireductor basaltis]|uniref:Putative membrane Spanning protein n=1 Tax=Nitratireductor basaltis TaxID=472175 RepID=A0A084U9L5_9HYPH|nr:peptidase inhibitor family I36 protein [Nitratireductor basaltis]KFB09651.1 putative membrane Spanning protein [Nitratireductor basaltis]
MSVKAGALFISLSAIILSLVNTLPTAAQEPVEATRTVNLRNGPGLRFDVIDRVGRGDRMQRFRCSRDGQWCVVRYRRQQGWVSSRFIRQASAGGARRGEVCFFEHAQFKGRSHCAGVGEEAGALRGFLNNRISSIRIRGNAKATVCTRRNWGGRCRTFDASVSQLPRGQADRISSFRVTRAGGQQGGNRPNPGFGSGGQHGDNKPGPGFGSGGQHGGNEPGPGFGSGGQHGGNKPGPGFGSGGQHGGNQQRQVCFYEHINYGGDQFCMRRGQKTAELDRRWNDRISSIRVPRGSRVRVCQHKNFGGWCDTYTGNVPVIGQGLPLGGGRNDNVTSIEVLR